MHLLKDLHERLHERIDILLWIMELAVLAMRLCCTRFLVTSMLHPIGLQSCLWQSMVTVSANVQECLHLNMALMSGTPGTLGLLTSCLNFWTTHLYRMSFSAFLSRP